MKGPKKVNNDSIYPNRSELLIEALKGAENQKRITYIDPYHPIWPYMSHNLGHHKQDDDGC